MGTESGTDRLSKAGVLEVGDLRVWNLGHWRACCLRLAIRRALTNLNFLRLVVLALKQGVQVTCLGLGTLAKSSYLHPFWHLGSRNSQFSPIGEVRDGIAGQWRVCAIA